MVASACSWVLIRAGPGLLLNRRAHPLGGVAGGLGGALGLLLGGGQRRLGRVAHPLGVGRGSVRVLDRDPAHLGQFLGGLGPAGVDRELEVLGRLRHPGLRLLQQPLSLATQRLSLGLGHAGDLVRLILGHLQDLLDPQAQVAVAQRFLGRRRQPARVSQGRADLMQLVGQNPDLGLGVLLVGDQCGELLLDQLRVLVDVAAVIAAEHDIERRLTDHVLSHRPRPLWPDVALLRRHAGIVTPPPRFKRTVAATLPRSGHSEVSTVDIRGGTCWARPQFLSW